MGRQKLYNRNDALASIKRCFWRTGYAATSLHDLEQATGLPKQTLYREFSSKEGMYIAALASYDREEVESAIRLLHQHDLPNLRFAALFDSLLETAETPAGRDGCFLCNAAADRTGIERIVSDAVSASLTRLRDAFAAALNASATDDHFADSLLATYVGFRSLIRNHWPMEKLRAVADEILMQIEKRQERENQLKR